MDFRELEALRRLVAETSDRHVKSLAHYYEPTTFAYRHLYAGDPANPRKTSKASTSTCVVSLSAAGKWAKSPGESHGQELATRLLVEEWSSSGLKPNNAFTVA